MILNESRAYLPVGYNSLKRKAAEPLFIYLPLNKRGLAAKQRRIVKELNLPGIKPTDLTKFHITLVFVENCSDSTITQVLKSFRPPTKVSLEITSVEVLDGGDMPALVWRVDPDPGLVRLQRDLYNALLEEVDGMSEYSVPDKWLAHITIAYDLPTTPAKLPVIEPFRLTADRFVVGRDEFRDIATVKLDGGARQSKGFVEKLYSTELEESNLYTILRGEKAVVGPMRRVLGLKDGPFSVRVDKEYVVKRRSVDKLDVVKGGEGSGNFDHAGRPGERGGSAPSGGSGTPEWKARRTDFESRLAERYGTAEPGTIEATSIAWLGPSGKLIAPGGDHQESAIWLLGHTFGSAHEQIEAADWGRDTDEVVNQGMIRVNASAGQALAFDLPKDVGAVTEQQLDVMGRLAIQVAAEDQTVPSVIITFGGPFRDNSERGLVDNTLYDENAIEFIGLDTEFLQDVAEGRVGVERGGPGSGNFGHAGRPGEVGGSQAENGGNFYSRYPKVGNEIAGLRVTDEIANTSSISASLYKWEILDDVREIKFTDFKDLDKPSFYSQTERKQTEELAAAIKENGYIDPLIVVIDDKGPWVLEGGHRFDALQIAGYKSFPALLVVDREKLPDTSSVERGGEGSGNFDHAGRPGEVGGSATDGGTKIGQRFSTRKYPAAYLRALPDAIKQVGEVVRPSDVKGHVWSLFLTPDGDLVHISGEHRDNAEEAALAVQASDLLTNEEKESVRNEAWMDAVMASGVHRLTVISPRSSSGYANRGVAYQADTSVTSAQWDAAQAIALAIDASFDEWTVDTYTNIGTGKSHKWQRIIGLTERGGEGSGNFDHAGRPGEVGGSASSNGGGKAEGGAKVYAAGFDARDANNTYAMARRILTPVEGEGKIMDQWVSPLGEVYKVEDGHNASAMSVIVAMRDEGEREFYEKYHTGEEIDDPEELFISLGWMRVSGRYQGGIGLQWREDLTDSQLEVVARIVISAERSGRQIDYDSRNNKGDIDTLKDEVLGFKSLTTRGGPGSGHFTHDGRPGSIGGSTPGEGGPASWNEVGERASVLGPRVGQISTVKQGATREQAQRFYDRRKAVEAANRFKYMDGNSSREVIDAKLLEGPSTIRRERFYYEIANRESGQSMKFTRSEERDYIDTLMNHGRFARNYDLVERGGPGSGHRGHAGRPGEIGGSQAGDGSPTTSKISNKQSWNDARKRTATGWRSPGETNPRYSMAYQAFNDGDPDDEDRPANTYVLESNGDIKAVYSLSRESDEDGDVFLYHLATQESGWGREAMASIAREVFRMDANLVLESTDKSAGFYRKLGMHIDRRFGVNFYKWTKSDVSEARFILTEKALVVDEEDDEPEDGVFTTRHLGPGPHPSGSEQDVHASGGGSTREGKGNGRGAAKEIYHGTGAKAARSIMKTGLQVGYADSNNVVDGVVFAAPSYETARDFASRSSSKSYAIITIDPSLAGSKPERGPIGGEFMFDRDIPAEAIIKVDIYGRGETRGEDRLLETIERTASGQKLFAAAAVGENEEFTLLGPTLDDMTKRHYGPGPHPSGTEQDVHSGGGGGAREGKKGEAAGGVAAGKVESKPASEGARRLAGEMATAAMAMEPALSSMMGDIATTTGGELVGLKYAVKPEESLAGKIDRDATEKGITHEQAAAEITDVNRYTMVFDSDKYTESVLAAQQELAEKGYIQYDEKWKNYFGSGDAYDGYNSVYMHQETGERVEVQFHTPDTIGIKERAHELYERFRVTPEGSLDRLTLWEDMQSMWQDYEKPAGWESLPGNLIGVERSMPEQKPVMDYRYFVRIQSNPDRSDYGQPLSAHRFAVTENTVVTERWEGGSGVWVDNPDLLAFTGIGGSDDYREVDQVEAERFVKTASQQNRMPGQKYEISDEDRRQKELDEAQLALYEQDRNQGRNIVAKATDSLVAALRTFADVLTGRGGPGSGHFGHSGRIGEVGGSDPGEGGSRTDWQGRPLAADRKIVGGTLTKEEVAIFDLARQNPLGRFFGKDVDQEALDTLKVTGLVKALPKLAQSYKQAYQMTAAGNQVRTQLERIRQRDLAQRGGPGSGHHGHAGRPGERGGSAPGEGGGGKEKGKSYRGGKIVPLTELERSRVADRLKYFGEHNDPADVLSESSEIPRGKFPIKDPDTGEVVWLTGGRDPVLSHIEDQFRDSEIENGTFILEDGTLLIRATGNANKILFTDDEINTVRAAIKDGETVIFTHNHPSWPEFPGLVNNTFSQIDVNTAISNLGFSEIRATVLGGTYVMRILDLDKAAAQYSTMKEVAMIAFDVRLEEVGLDRSLINQDISQIDQSDFETYMKAIHEGWIDMAKVFPDLVEYEFIPRESE